MPIDIIIHIQVRGSERISSRLNPLLLNKGKVKAYDSNLKFLSDNDAGVKIITKLKDCEASILENSHVFFPQSDLKKAEGMKACKEAISNQKYRIAIKHKVKKSKIRNRSKTPIKK